MGTRGSLTGGKIFVIEIRKAVVFLYRDLCYTTLGQRITDVGIDDAPNLHVRLMADCQKGNEYGIYSKGNGCHAYADHCLGGKGAETATGKTTEQYGQSTRKIGNQNGHRQQDDRRHGLKRHDDRHDPENHRY